LHAEISKAKGWAVEKFRNIQRSNLDGDGVICVRKASKGGGAYLDQVGIGNLFLRNKESQDLFRQYRYGISDHSEVSQR
jgi:hypothetical protein